MNVTPPAIVLGGQSIALPVVRSLGRAGINVYAVGTDVDAVQNSRYCTRYVHLGGWPGSAGRWLDWLRDGAPPDAVILPCNDVALELVARHRAELLARGYLPMRFHDDVVLAMLDKERTYALARKRGIDVPRTVAVRRPDEAEAAAGDVGYPCALKPLNSYAFRRHFGTSTRMFLANDVDELRAALARTLPLGLEMLVTELIPGPDRRLFSYCGYFDERGCPLIEYAFRKIRQYPPLYGHACYAVSCWDEDLADHGRRFAKRMGLQGVAHVEFKHDPRDGRLKLIECNHRFTIEAVMAGTNLPLLVYNDLVARPWPGVSHPPLGMHQWNPVEDVRALLRYRREGEWPMMRWLRSLFHRQRFYVFDWRDPLPTLGFHRRWIGQALRRRLPWRARRASGARP